jgi:hypothetical protein
MNRRYGKFEAGVIIKLSLLIGIVSIVFIGSISGTIGSSNNTPPTIIKESGKSATTVKLSMVPHPIFGTAEYEGGGWAVGADVEVKSSEGTLTDTVGASGEWQVDCGDPGPNWPEDTAFTVWIYGIDAYEGYIGTASGTVEGHYNDMGKIILILVTPDLKCEGSLQWTDVKPDSTVTGNFKIYNDGDPGSKLDWNIDMTSLPSWGTDWSFTPPNGNNLTPEDGKLTVEVSVIAPNQENMEFSGEIKVVNKENTSDACPVSVKLVTPLHQNTHSSNSLQIWKRFKYHV